MGSHREGGKPLSGLGIKGAIVGTDIINTSGGLKSCDHPIGSFPIRMIHDIHDRFVGRAGRVQVKGGGMGLVHNLGGPGAVSAMAVFSHR